MSKPYLPYLYFSSIFIFILEKRGGGILTRPWAMRQGRWVSSSYGHALPVVWYPMAALMAMALPLIPTSITTLPHHSAIDAIVEANF